jgi:two-component system, NarL family, response regulator LiaR
MTPGPLRVLLADPDALARRMVCATLDAAEGIAVVAEAGTAREAVELARYHRPDVLVAEATQPDLEPEELCRRMRSAAPATHVVLLCARQCSAEAVRCLRAGAVGYLGKEADVARLASAIHGVADGEAAVSRRLTLELVEALRTVPDTGWRPVRSRLTTREWEIVDLLGEGASTDGIAEQLYLSPATVYSHVKNVLAKLDVHSRGEAVDVATRLRREEAADYTAVV